MEGKRTTLTEMMLGESRVMCRFCFFFTFFTFVLFINFSHMSLLDILIIFTTYIGGALLCGSSCGENYSSTHWSVEFFLLRAWQFKLKTCWCTHWLVDYNFWTFELYLKTSLHTGQLIQLFQLLNFNLKLEFLTKN